MAGTQKENNEKIKEERRRLILFTAMDVFARKGFAASKMSDISDEAHISYGLLYYYFKSKDEIYAELLHRAAESSRKMVDEIDRQRLGPIEKIHTIAARVLSGLEQKHYTAYYFVLCAQALMSNANPRSVCAIIGEILDPLQTLARIIREGQQADQIKPGDPGDMAVALFSAVLGLSSLTVAGRIDRIPKPDILCRILE